MTPTELIRMRRADGLYLVGDERYHHFTFPIAVMGASDEQPGVAYVMEPRAVASRDASLWPEESHVLTGPITVESVRALDRKAKEVEDLVTELEHDLQTWKARALAAEGKLGSKVV